VSDPFFELILEHHLLNFVPGLLSEKPVFGSGQRKARSGRSEAAENAPRQRKKGSP